MRIALERRIEILRELDELETFIKFGESLIKEAADAHVEERVLAAPPTVEVKEPQQMSRGSFGSQAATDSFQFQSLLEDERKRRVSAA